MRTRKISSVKSLRLQGVLAGDPSSHFSIRGSQIFFFFFVKQGLWGMLRGSWFSKYHSETLSQGEIQTLAEAGREGCSPQTPFTRTKGS